MTSEIRVVETEGNDSNFHGYYDSMKKPRSNYNLVQSASIKQPFGSSKKSLKSPKGLLNKAGNNVLSYGRFGRSNKYLRSNSTDSKSY